MSGGGYHLRYMKKKIISAALTLTMIVGVGLVAVRTADAQGFSIQQLVSLFISLGIIPADKVAQAEAAVGLPITVANTSTVAATPAPVQTVQSVLVNDTTSRINFNLYAVALDGINVSADITNQLAQAAAFIAANSRFNIVYTVASSNTPHTFAKYDCNYYGTFEPQGCVDLAAAQLDPNFVSSLPIADGYMFFFDLNGAHPLEGGSTYGARTVF